ncbi:MAG: metal ABC transporter ATP-binding protein [Candidatus Peribacteraceae bacterium]|nr:metal ABC transporter ATP-binding protein [Candidatus Peribacteraceae bacterium]
MNAPAIEFKGVTYRYGASPPALEDVTCAIPQGAFVGIVGPNGAGKSTFIRLILGLITPSKGSVSVTGAPPREARKMGHIGYVPQKISQSDFRFPATVEEVVLSGRTALRGIGRFFTQEDRRQAADAMHMTGIGHLGKRLAGTLSGGERQRVFIARALAGNPRLLILDEPETGVDAATSHDFFALLKTFHQNGLTIVLVSHDLSVMAKEAQNILCLNRRLIGHCTPHELGDADILTRLYGTDVTFLQHHH